MTHTHREREMGQLNKSGCAIILYDGYVYQSVAFFIHIYTLCLVHTCA